jgi:predicted RNA-binding Zn-ribbon protein involved in translation (DUF1610 family)
MKPTTPDRITAHALVTNAARGLSLSRWVLNALENLIFSGVKLLATLYSDYDGIAKLIERLRRAGIDCETRTVTEESGLAAVQILVEDEYYDAACATVEAWSDDARRTHHTCPKCGSPHVDREPHDRVEFYFKCKDCGCEIFK